ETGTGAEEAVRRGHLFTGRGIRLPPLGPRPGGRSPAGREDALFLIQTLSTAHALLPGGEPKFGGCFRRNAPFTLPDGPEGNVRGSRKGRKARPESERR